MSAVLTPINEDAAPGLAKLRRSETGRRPSRSERQERRRRTALLRYAEDFAVRRANFVAVAALLREAESIVGRGWLQHGWFAYDDSDGRRHVLTAHGVGRLGNRPVTAACLVGAVVHAGGGPTAATSPAVGRALEVVWLTRHGRRADLDDGDNPDWNPAPPVHLARVCDLTRWNDEPARTAADVRGLLHRALLRAEAGATAAPRAGSAQPPRAWRPAAAAAPPRWSSP